MVGALETCAIVHNGDVSRLQCVYHPGGVALVIGVLLLAGGLVSAVLYWIYKTQ